MGKSFRQFLKGLELEAETIDSIMAEFGAHTTRNLERITELEKQAGEIEILRGQVEEINTLKAENEDSKTTITNLEAQIEQLKQNHSEEITKMMVQGELAKKFRDPKDVLPQLDLTKVQREGDVLKGLDEQATALLESKPYLAIGGEQKKKTSSDHTDPTGDDMSVFRSIYGLPEAEESK